MVFCFMAIITLYICSKKSIENIKSIMSSGCHSEGKPHPTPLLLGEGKHEILGEVNTQNSHRWNLYRLAMLLNDGFDTLQQVNI